MLDYKSYMASSICGVLVFDPDIEKMNTYSRPPKRVPVGLNIVMDDQR